jgi:hypothetical protein
MFKNKSPINKENRPEWQFNENYKFRNTSPHQVTQATFSKTIYDKKN